MKLKSIFLKTLKAYRAGEGSLRASALTYQSTLALVPILILITLGTTQGDSLTHLFKILNLINDRFDLSLPLASAPDLIIHLKSFNLKSLGLMGLLPLIVIFMGSMAQLENAFNAMWKIEDRRTWKKRVVVYLPFIFIPSLMIAIGINILEKLIFSLFTFFDSNVPFAGQFKLFGLSLIFFAALLIGMMLFFKVIPKIKVHLYAAFWAGMFTAFFSWLTVSLTLKFQSYLFAHYSALYGSLAFFPLFLIISYIQWNLILFGCALSSQIEPPSQNK